MVRKIKDYLSVYKTLITMIHSQRKILYLAIIFGSMGHIMATAIPALAAYGATQIVLRSSFQLSKLVGVIIILSIVRAIFKYLEQLCNHHVAFKTLAIIRDLVFKKLRQLAPAKMEGRDKGELIAYVTSDTELLEVFYAHTISPIVIALIHTTFFVIIMAHYHVYFAILLGGIHLGLGIVFPLMTAKKSGDRGTIQRQEISQLNTQIIDTFTGIDTCIQYKFGEKRYEEIENQMLALESQTRYLSQAGANNRIVSTVLVLLANIVSMGIAGYLYLDGHIASSNIIVPIVILISSFGPVTALSNLANDLALTYASGKRITSLLNENPVVVENNLGDSVVYQNICGESIDFSYGEERVLKAVNFDIRKGEIIGISGQSGAGKSTLLKLMMRFFNPDSGQIKMNHKSIDEINAHSLKENIAYMTQTTHIVNGTVIDNMRIAKPDASLKEIREACKKASIDTFFLSLPNQYYTEIANVKSMLSSGEMQRLSLARVFLHDGDLLLLDEPTANIDSLNESVILKSLWEASKDKSILIVSHKASALRIAQRILKIEREVS